jgi:hypothetical protein
MKLAECSAVCEHRSIDSKAKARNLGNYQQSTLN